METLLFRSLLLLSLSDLLQLSLPLLFTEALIAEPPECQVQRRSDSGDMGNDLGPLLIGSGHSFFWADRKLLVQKHQAVLSVLNYSRSSKSLQTRLNTVGDDRLLNELGRVRVYPSAVWDEAVSDEVPSELLLAISPNRIEGLELLAGKLSPSSSGYVETVPPVLRWLRARKGPRPICIVDPLEPKPGQHSLGPAVQQVLPAHLNLQQPQGL